MKQRHQTPLTLTSPFGNTLPDRADSTPIQMQ